MPSPIHQHPLAYLLGLEGVALLRAFAGEHGREFTEARIAEIRRLLDRADEIGPGVDVAPISVRDGYDGWSATYDVEGNSCFPMRDDLLAPLLDRLPTGRVLDAACGSGAVTRQLLDRGHDVVGVDGSPGMLGLARRAVPEATLLEGDLAALPLPDGDVDHVTCTLALSHVSDLRPFFAEAARVMRPGGHLITLDVRGYYARSPLFPLVQQTPDGRVGYMPGGSHETSDYLRAALPHGFVVRACEELFAPPYVPCPDPEPTPLPPPARRTSGSWCPGSRKRRPPPTPGGRRSSPGTSSCGPTSDYTPIRSPSTSTSSSGLRSGQKHTSPATPCASRSGVSYPHTASCSARSPTRTDQ